jgi:predicted Zn-dependent protease
MMNRIRFFISLAGVFLTIALYLQSCAINPVTGKRELMLMSEAQEIQLGRESDPQITAMYGAYQDDELTPYIDGLGQRIAKISHRSNLQFTFRVLDSPVVNAFAVPGGYVYVTRGILAYMNDEAELAGVLGHEIGHITARHTAKQYSNAQLASLGLGIGKMISEDFRKYAGYAELGVGLLFLRFSRDNEREADQLGVEYSTKIGYDATRMSDFFTTLERLAGGAAQGGLPGWFTTHPNPTDRVAATRRQALAMQQEIGTGNWQVNRESYFQRIDGLVYGNDPRQGFVETHMFYHPALRFQFPVPQGWQVENQPTQVQIVSPENTAAILLSIEEGTDPQGTAQQFTERTNAQVLSAEATSVNGLRGYWVLSDIQSEQSPIRVLSYFIAKDTYVYTFHGLSSLDQFPSYQETFKGTMTNFAQLRDQGIINIKPRRLHIVSAERTALLGTILQQYSLPDEMKQELAILNGTTLDQTVTAGSRIKIVDMGP